MNKKKEVGTIVLVLYFLGKLFYYTQVLYFLPLWLSTEEQGGYRMIRSAIFLFAQIDLGEAVLRYFPYFKGHSLKKSALMGWVLVINTVTYVLFATAFVGGNMLFHFSVNKLAGHFTHYLPLIALQGYIVLLCVLVKVWYSVLRRVIWPNFLQQIVLQGMNLAVLYFYRYYGLSFEALTLLMGLPYLVHLCLMLGYLYSLGELRLSLDKRHLPRGFLRFFLKYNLFVIFTSRCVPILMRVDAWIVGQSFGETKAAMYLMLVTLTLLLDVPMKVHKQTTGPQLAECLSGGNFVAANHLHKRQALEQCLLSTCAFVLLYLNWPWYIAYLPMLAEHAVEARFVFVFLGCAKVLSNLFSSSIRLLVLSKYYAFSGVNMLGIGLGALATKWLAVYWGISGVTLGLFASVLGLGLINTWLVWYHMRLHCFSWSMCYVPLLLGVVWLLASWLPMDLPWAIVCGNLLLCALCFFIGRRTFLWSVS